MADNTRDTMDFFEAQDVHRRNTVILLVYFTVAVALTATAAYFVTLSYWFVFNKVANFWRDLYDLDIIQFEWWNVHKYYFIAGPCAIALVSLSVWKTRQLAAPIDQIMPLIGATEVDHGIMHPPTKVYLDVVEEMSIASRTPMPRTFVIPREYGINAMAVGSSADSAAIAVSAGAIQMLTRDEMQGVVAHEFSHILNGDMAMNVRLLGVLYGIDSIGLIGRMFCGFLVRSGRLGIPGHSNVLAMGAWVALLLCLPFAFLSWLGLIFGQLIRAAISRQREYLADASAVQFTRFPDGIAGALTKIGGLTAGSAMRGTAMVASHFFLASAFGTSSGLLSVASHPPLSDRIKRITPNFDGDFPYLPMHYEAKMGDPRKAAWQPGSRDPEGGPAAPAITTESGTRMSPEDITSALTAPNPAYVSYVRKLFMGLPDALVKTASVPETAMLLVYAVLLSHDDRKRADEVAVITDREGEERAKQADSLSRILKTSNPEAEVPLLEKAFASMSKLARPELEEAYESFSRIFSLTQPEDSSEYIFPAAIRARLSALSGKGNKSGLAIKKMASVEHEITTIAAFLVKWKALAEAASQKEPAAQLASRILWGIDLKQIDTSPTQLENACAKIARADPHLKRELLVLAVKLLAPNGIVSPASAEMIWLLAELTRARIPPLMPGELTKRLKR